MIFQIRCAEDLRALQAGPTTPDTDIQWELHPEITEDDIRKVFFLTARFSGREGLCVTLAEWYGTPVDILAELARIDSLIVRQAVALHPRCPEGVLAQLAVSGDSLTQQHAEWTIGRRLLMEQNLPAGTFWDLYKRNLGHESHKIALRYEMIKHPNIPLQLLHALAQDTSPQVRGPAEMRLRMAPR